MNLNYSMQDNLLLEDILKRNYFLDFNSEIKTINLSFFFNDEYTDYNLIPGYESLELKNNLDIIFNNFSLFLDWYKLNNFNTKIKIHDNLLLLNETFFYSLIDLILTKKIQYTSLVLYIDTNFKEYDLNKIKNLIQRVKEKINIEIIFNTPLEQFKNILNYSLENFGIFNILLSPGINSHILIENQLLINQKYNHLINDYIEIDNDQWTSENISEYFKYILFLLDLDNINIFNTKLPIGLINQGVLNNSNCKKNCDFQQSLNILFSDFSINLCHKFQYDDLIIGYFKSSNDNKILTIEAKNLPSIILNTHLKRSSTPHCEKCSYINLCKGFCFFNSYQKCLNPIIPIRESCNLKKSKFSFIFSYFINKQIDFENLIKNNNLPKLYNFYLLNIYNILKGKGDFKVNDNQ